MHTKLFCPYKMWVKLPIMLATLNNCSRSMHVWAVSKLWCSLLLSLHLTVCKLEVISGDVYHTYWNHRLEVLLIQCQWQWLNNLNSPHPKFLNLITLISLTLIEPSRTVKSECSVLWIFISWPSYWHCPWIPLCSVSCPMGGLECVDAYESHYWSLAALVGLELD